MSIGLIKMIAALGIASLPIGPVSVPVEPVHGIYLAVIQIDHTDTDTEAAVLLKVFTTDLQDVIRAAFPKKSHPVEDEAFIAENKALVAAYFSEHFSCRFNNEKAASMSFISGSLENDVYWLKFAMEVPVHWTALSIKAPFFMEVFPAQSNVIQVLHGSEKRFARLTKSADEAVLDF